MGYHNFGLKIEEKDDRLGKVSRLGGSWHSAVKSTSDLSFT